ncbi:MAG: YIP1 family protein [Halobacteriaceae archaeon]
MTTWVEESGGGRDRGPRAVLRAWLEVLLRPRRFFRTGVAPGDQAPGLVFAMAVTAVASATHLATRPEYATGVGSSPAASLLLVFLLYVVVVGPVLLHLIAAVQTILLRALVQDRGGVSETVQVLAYATAPCVLAGLPVPALRVVVAIWGAVLLVIGTVTVHNASVGQAVAVAAVPAILVFGYAFGGIEAGRTLVEQLLHPDDPAGQRPGTPTTTSGLQRS